jgi:hypothetical protein
VKAPSFNLCYKVKNFIYLLYNYRDTMKSFSEFYRMSVSSLISTTLRLKFVILKQTAQTVHRFEDQKQIGTCSRHWSRKSDTKT